MDTNSTNLLVLAIILHGRLLYVPLMLDTTNKAVTCGRADVLRRAGCSGALITGKD